MRNLAGLRIALEENRCRCGRHGENLRTSAEGGRAGLISFGKNRRRAQNESGSGNIREPGAETDSGGASGAGCGAGLRERGTDSGRASGASCGNGVGRAGNQFREGHREKALQGASNACDCIGQRARSALHAAPVPETRPPETRPLPQPAARSPLPNLVPLRIWSRSRIWSAPESGPAPESIPLPDPLPVHAPDRREQRARRTVLLSAVFWPAYTTARRDCSGDTQGERGPLTKIACARSRPRFGRTPERGCSGLEDELDRSREWCRHALAQEGIELDDTIETAATTTPLSRFATAARIVLTRPGPSTM